MHVQKLTLFASFATFLRIFVIMRHVQNNKSKAAKASDSSKKGRILYAGNAKTSSHAPSRACRLPRAATLAYHTSAYPGTTQSSVWLSPSR